MTLIYADRVRETTITTGTGTYNLAGVVVGFQTFVAGIGNANTCFYSVEDGTDWEVGIGTVTDAAPDTLARTTVIASSNAGAAVDWGAGTKKIFGVHPAREIEQLFPLAALADVATDEFIVGTGANIYGLKTPAEVRTILTLGVIAIQSAVEAETDQNTYVPPDLIKHSPGVVKFWCLFNGASAGPITPDIDYNVVDVTDETTGDYTVNIDIDFSGSDWAPFGMTEAGAGEAERGITWNDVGIAAGTLRIQRQHSGGTNEDGVCSVGGLGDQ